MSPSLTFFVCCWNTLAPKAEHGVSASSSGILTIILPCQTQKEESREMKELRRCFWQQAEDNFFLYFLCVSSICGSLSKKTWPPKPPTHSPTHSVNPGWELLDIFSFSTNKQLWLMMRDPNSSGSEIITVQWIPCCQNCQQRNLQNSLSHAQCNHHILNKIRFFSGCSKFS